MTSIRGSGWLGGGCVCCERDAQSLGFRQHAPGTFIADDPHAAGASGRNAAAANGRIDVHHHVAPPPWLNEAIGRDLLQPATRQWSAAKSIEDMDAGGVATAVVSVTNPGLWFGDVAQSRRLARASNDFMAQLARDHRGRFGFFAAMPLPDVEGTLSEIAYALDTLKADGIGLFTSYRDIWLGNDAFSPVMAELNRRKAVVFVHPTAAMCCMNLIPDVAPGVMEYGTDTTRAMVGLLFSGAAVRFADIRFIWSHAGGTAPFLAGRIEAAVGRLIDREKRLPNGAIHEMKRFFYDIAGAANVGALVSLFSLVAKTQVMFGTDYPSGFSRDIINGLADLKLSAPDVAAINRGNALRLLPQFAK